MTEEVAAAVPGGEAVPYAAVESELTMFEGLLRAAAPIILFERFCWFHLRILLCISWDYHAWFWAAV